MKHGPELNISERLKLAGFSHRRTPNAVNTGRHYVTSIATGECIGEWTAFQSLDFLESNRHHPIARLVSRDSH